MFLISMFQEDALDPDDPAHHHLNQVAKELSTYVDSAALAPT